MKRAFTTIATIILATTISASVSATGINKSELLNQYSSSIENGNYFNSRDAFFVTTVNGNPIFQLYDGTVCYDNEILCQKIISAEKIINDYEAALNNGEYYTTNASQHTVNLDGVECYQKMDGTFIYDSKVLIENVEEFIGYNVLKQYIAEFYIHQIRTGNYTQTLGKMNYVVMTDTYDMCYVTEDGKLMCGGITIYENIATMNNLQTNETVIYQDYGTAISVDTDFVKVYYFGEIVQINNIHTGNSPRG